MVLLATGSSSVGLGHRRITADERLAIRMVKSPSGPASAQPRLIAVEGGVAMSWLERDGHGHRLQWSRWNGKQWSRPVTIAKGDCSKATARSTSPPIAWTHTSSRVSKGQSRPNRPPSETSWPHSRECSPLGFRAGKVPGRPAFPSIEVRNTRSGFFEDEDLEVVLERLPESVRSLVRFTYFTGWRSAK